MVRPRQRYKIWLAAVILLLMPSLLPSLAMAHMEVRCLGAPPQSAPCLTRLAEEDAGVAVTRQMTMPCCASKSDAQNVSAPTCLVTTTPGRSEQPALSSVSFRWLLDAAPALAPPAAPPVSRALFPVLTRRPASSISLFQPRFPNLHGLRAPPAV